MSRSCTFRQLVFSAFLIGSGGLSAANADDAEVEVLRWKWTADGLKAPAELKDYRVDDKFAAGVRVVNPEDETITVRLATISAPQLTTNYYGLRGKVRYQDVAGQGYLEMWNVLADGSRYFSRTLSASGPMGRLEGSAEWRDFLLPFRKRTDVAAPTQLEFNLVLAGSGAVDIRDVVLVESTSPVEVRVAGAWWQAATANRYGGWAGAGIGVLGGLLGTLMGIPAIRRRGSGILIWACGLTFLGGVVTLVIGLYAVLIGQPWHVWYPLVLLGGIVSAVFPVTIVQMRSRLQAEGLRKISAMDAVHG